MWTPPTSDQVNAMLNFLSENWGNILVCLVVLLVVVLCVRHLIRQKKAGSGCGCDCSDCAGGCPACGGGQSQSK